MDFITRVRYSPDLAQEIQGIVQGSKVTVVEGFPAEGDYASFYKELAGHLGLFIYADEDYRTGKFTPNVWTRVQYIKEASFDTYKHSNRAQPMHTDYCYVPMLEVVLLICDEQARIGGATTFVDADEVYDILQQYNPGLLHKLENTPVKFGKGDNPIMTNTVKVLSKNAAGVTEVNWSRFRVSDQNEPETLAMVNEFDTFMVDFVERAGITVPVMLRKGEAAFIRDNLVIHGRNAFFGERCLLKGAVVMTNVEQARDVLAKVL